MRAPRSTVSARHVGTRGGTVNALDGLRVVDLSATRLGAQVSQVLADFGADVMWVEPPGGAVLREAAAFPYLARCKACAPRCTSGSGAASDSASRRIWCRASPRSTPGTGSCAS